MMHRFEMSIFDKQMPKEKDSPEWDAFLKHHDELIQAIPRWRKWNFQPDTQEDMAQKIRMEVVKAGPSFKGGSSVAYFIKQIGKRRCIDEVRRQIRKHWLLNASDLTPPGEEDYDIIGSAPEESRDLLQEIETVERAHFIRQELHTLDDTCKNALTLFYLHGKTYPEISDELGITQNTVGSRLAKCLKKFSERLTKHSAFEEYFPSQVRP